MRISGINQFLGGADAVVALEIIDGEHLRYQGVVRDKDGNVIDITHFNLSAVANFYEATVEDGRREEKVITDFISVNPNIRPPRELRMEVTDGPNGQFLLIIPYDLYAGQAKLDATELVPLAVIYLSYEDVTEATIDISRLIAVIRRGPENGLVPNDEPVDPNAPVEEESVRVPYARITATRTSGTEDVSLFGLPQYTLGTDANDTVVIHVSTERGILVFDNNNNVTLDSSFFVGGGDIFRPIFSSETPDGVSLTIVLGELVDGVFEEYA